MTNLVLRLRQWRASVTAMDSDRFRMIGEAADEIERLRAALTATETRAQNALDAMDDDNSTTRACRDVVAICDRALAYQQPTGAKE